MVYDVQCLFLQLPAATMTGLWRANLLPGACLEWCPLFRRQQPFCSLMSGVQTDGRVFIIPASIFWQRKSMIWLGGTCTFVSETISIDAPVFFWIFSVWMGTRCQQQRCVPQRSAQVAGVLSSSCLIQTLYFRSETLKKLGKELPKNARSCCRGMDSRAIAAKRRYVDLWYPYISYT